MLRFLAPVAVLAMVATPALAETTKKVTTHKVHKMKTPKAKKVTTTMTKAPS